MHIPGDPGFSSGYVPTNVLAFQLGDSFDQELARILRRSKEDDVVPLDFLHEPVERKIPMTHNNNNDRL